MSSGVVHWTVDGDWLTETVRNLWQEDNPAAAIESLLSSIPEQPGQVQIALDIVQGRWRINSETTGLVEEETPVTVHRTMPLLSVADNIIRLEERYHEQYESTEGTRLFIANPRRYDMDLDDVRHYQGVLEVQRTELNRRFTAIQKLCEVTGTPFRSNPAPKLDFDFVQQEEDQTEREDEHRYFVPSALTLGKHTDLQETLAERAAAGDAMMKGIAQIMDVDPSLVGLDAYMAKAKQKEAPFKPSDITQWHSGWVARNGDFYPCRGEEHMYLAPKLVEKFYPGETTYDKQRFLEKKGWAKLSLDRVQYGGPLEPERGEPDYTVMSANQIKTFKKWFEAKGKEDFNYDGGRVTWPEFLENNKPRTRR